MPRNRLRRTAVAAGLALLFAAAAARGQDRPQDPPPLVPPPPPAGVPGEKPILLQCPTAGWSLLDLLEAVNSQSDRSVLFDSEIQKKIEGRKVKFMGTYRVPRSRLFDWLQGVLSFQNYILIPIGPSGHEQWMVVDVTNPTIRSRPTYVPEEDLDLWKDRDGVYIVSTLRVKSLDAADLQRARTGIQQLLTTTATIGRINEVPGQNAFIIADFAPVVYASKRLLMAMDVPITANQQVLERVLIQYALASDMESMLTDLLGGLTAQGQPRRPVNPQQPLVKPDPQIIADNRTNSLILYAVPEDIRKIKELIAQLDTEFRGKSRIHFRTLMYQESEDVQGLLQELISGTGSVSSAAGRTSSRSTSRTNRSRNTNTPGTPQQPNAFGSTPNEGDPIILADVKNNSLIIHATEDQYKDLTELIEKLDRPRKQVLIETALMELSVGEQLDLGVDLFGVSDRVAVDTDGNGEVDTFTDSRQFFATSFFGNSTIAQTNVNGIDVPIGVSPNIGQGLTAGIFKNGRIPMIFKALQSRSPTKLLTMPSIVTSDNQSATIKTTDKIPYKTTTFVGPNSTPSESFEEVSAETNLTISPSISADDFLRLHISQQVASFGSPPAPGQRPPSTTRNIETELMVPNRATVVLGGLIQSQESSVRSGIPVLMDIPVLGALFQNSTKKETRTNLYLFVTPTIMSDLATFSDYHRLTWDKKLQQNDLYGEEVKLLGTTFLGPNVPRSAKDAVLRIDASGSLDAYRYGGEPSEAERVDAARRAWEQMQKEKERAAPPVPPVQEPAPAPGAGQEPR